MNHIKLATELGKAAARLAFSKASAAPPVPGPAQAAPAPKMLGLAGASKPPVDPKMLGLATVGQMGGGAPKMPSLATVAQAGGGAPKMPSLATVAQAGGGDKMPGLAGAPKPPVPGMAGGAMGGPLLSPR